jgi:hypothetical protein
MLNTSLAQTMEVKNTYEWGKLENGIKVGVWQYLDYHGDVSLIVNHNSGRILFEKPMSAEFDILINGKWERHLIDRVPNYLGSMDYFHQNFYRSIRYTNYARINRIGGTSKIGIVIDSSGVIREYQILEQAGAGLDEEVIRVLKNLSPRFIPAVYQGKRVTSRMDIAVTFSVGMRRYDQTSSFIKYDILAYEANYFFSFYRPIDDRVKKRQSLSDFYIDLGHTTDSLPFSEIFNSTRLLLYQSDLYKNQDPLPINESFTMKYESSRKSNGAISQSIIFEDKNKKSITSYLETIDANHLPWKNKLSQVIYGGKDYIYFPAYIVNQYTITASAPPLYIDTERLTEGNFWEFEVNISEVGSLLNGHLNCYYRVLEQKEISMPWGIVNDCWLIRAEATHITLGKSYVDFIFHEQWGMLRAEYRFFNGDQLNISLQSYASKNIIASQD